MRKLMENTRNYRHQKSQSSFLSFSNNEKFKNFVLLERIISYSNLELSLKMKRISKYSRFMGELVKIDITKLIEIENMTKIYEIGNLGLDRELVEKKGIISEKEYQKLKEHVIIGYDIIEKAKLGKIAENIALCHHEKWDGTGYPRGLKSENIPLEARIVTICEKYDFIMEKNYTNLSKSYEEIIEIIKNESEMSFDPRLVEIIELNQDKFKAIYEKLKMENRHN